MNVEISAAHTQERPAPTPRFSVAQKGQNGRGRARNGFRMERGGASDRHFRLLESRRCTARHPRSLGATPIYSPVPLIHLNLVNVAFPESSVTVYYDPKRIRCAEDCIDLMTRSAAVVAKEHVVLVGGKTVRSEAVLVGHGEARRLGLLHAPELRTRATAKVVACWAYAYAQGGFPFPQNPMVMFQRPVPVLVLHTGCPQLHFYEDARRFLRGREVEEDRIRDEWTRISGRILDAAVMEHRAKGFRVHLKIPPLGAFLFHEVCGLQPVKGQMVRLALQGLVRAVEERLDGGRLAKAIACIDLPDFS